MAMARTCTSLSNMSASLIVIRKKKSNCDAIKQNESEVEKNDF